MQFASAFTEIAAILVAAVGIGTIGTWLRQPLIVSFIVVGIAVGPAGLGLVSTHEEIELLASVGISLLLFVVGLKLDVDMIRTVGPVALATGIGQVVFTSAVGFLIAMGLGFELVPATYIAVALTFSSTIIIVKLLSDKREIDALHGRIAVGFLIVQDLAVILAMIGLTAIGPGEGMANDTPSGLSVLMSGIGFLAVVAVLTRWMLPWLTAYLARSPELLVLFGIAWATILAATGDALGFSKEVGAFLAGVSLASTPWRDTLGARMVTIRDFLLLFFFIELGSGLDLSLMGATLGPALVFSAFVLIGNPLIVMVIMGSMGYRKRTGFLAGLTVAQISEFSLILGALGLSLGHIDSETMGLITTVGLVTIALSTYLIIYSGPIYERIGWLLGPFERRMPYREMATDTPPPSEVDVVLFGLGRYGSGIARHLLQRNRRVIGVDFDPEALARWRTQGLGVFYGDAEDPELFDHLPLAGAKWVVSTTPEVNTNRVLLRHLQGTNFRGRVAVACRTAEDAEALRSAGADLLLTPFSDAAEQAADALTSGSEHLAAVAAQTPGLREVRLAPGSAWGGRTLAQIAVRDRYGVSVLAVSRSGRSYFSPGPDFQLFPGDRLFLSGEPGGLEQAVDYLARVDFAERPEDAQEVIVDEIGVDTMPGWRGATIASLHLRHAFDVTVVALRHEDGRLVAPDPHRPLDGGDRLVVTGTPAALARLREASEARSDA
jgi:Kef-type K+ transport system membrane component KefB/Trk K+ transport system NAD-binding subunit